MSKFPKLAAAVAIAATVFAVPAGAQDDDAGAKVYNKCKACHMVGDGAKNRVGPHLNDLFGRTAGAIEGFKYSNAMLAAGEAGTVWDEVTLTQFLVKPKDYVKGTKMAFAGLRKADDVANVIAYLKGFSAGAAPAGEDATADADSGDAAPKVEKVMAKDVPLPDHGGAFRLGRLASEDEVAAWDIDIRPDGMGLPVGQGTVADGEVLYTDNCAVCHGDFGEAVGRWPVLAGGQDTLADERPEKTVGSYWPYLSTVYDYVRRAMPFGNARSLSDDDVYAITAYLLYLNDIVDDEEFELSNENFGEVRLPNEANFIPDGRDDEGHYAEKAEPCMNDCKPGPVEITMRARVLDVTPDSDEENVSGGGID
ncbi:c-type cytochrome [Oricola sp.]|uniref:c-type cytochrome n=1 Tax=Oricola sp. TaxID=1979950 RepID=UPI003BA9C9B5